MKKWIVVSMAFAIFFVAACHKKAVPTVTDRSEQPPPPMVPMLRPEIAAGKTIYETKCARCHAPKPVDNYTPERWVGILKSMIPKAKLDSIEKSQVTAYVNGFAKKS